MALKSIACLTDTRASVSQFVKLRMNKGDWAITCDDSLVTAGSPTFTLLVCAFDGKEAQFRVLSDLTNDRPLNEVVSGENFKFAYLGLKYTPNGGMGDVQFYLNQ